jgi:hypothetical protein
MVSLYLGPLIEQFIRGDWNRVQLVFGMTAAFRFYV